MWWREGERPPPRLGRPVSNFRPSPGILVAPVPPKHLYIILPRLHVVSEGAKTQKVGGWLMLGGDSCLGSCHPCFWGHRQLLRPHSGDCTSCFLCFSENTDMDTPSGINHQGRASFWPVFPLGLHMPTPRAGLLSSPPHPGKLPPLAPVSSLSHTVWSLV